MPPVGAKVSAFSVSSDRWTASCQVPSYVQRAAHSSQNASVFVSASSGIDRLRRGLVGREPAQDEWHALSSGDRERPVGAEVPSLVLDRGPQENRVWPGDRDECALDRPHPRNDRAVVEAQSELHAHLDATTHTLDDPDEVRVRLTWRHEVDQPDDTVIRLELGLEDERVASVLPADRAELACGLDRPVAVFGVAEERREDGAGVESRHAEPVDGTVSADQRGGLEIADEPVILDTTGHDRRLSFHRQAHSRNAASRPKRFLAARSNAAR